MATWNGIEIGPLANRLAEKGRQENGHLRHKFENRLALSPAHLLAASEAHGLAWLTKNEESVFDGSYSQTQRRLRIYYRFSGPSWTSEVPIGQCWWGSRSRLYQIRGTRVIPF